MCIKFSQSSVHSSILALLLFHILLLLLLFGLAALILDRTISMCQECIHAMILFSFTSMEPLHAKVYKKNTTNSLTAAVLLLLLLYCFLSFGSIDRNRTHMIACQ